MWINCGQSPFFFFFLKTKISSPWDQILRHDSSWNLPLPVCYAQQIRLWQMLYRLCRSCWEPKKLKPIVYSWVTETLEWECNHTPQTFFRAILAGSRWIQIQLNTTSASAKTRDWNGATPSVSGSFQIPDGFFPESRILASDPKFPLVYQHFGNETRNTLEC